jgi:hypothetical protein
MDRPRQRAMPSVTAPLADQIGSAGWDSLNEWQA